MNNKLLAQNPTGLGQIGTGQGFGPFNFEYLNDSSILTAIAKIVSTIVGFITILGAIYFFLQLMIGAFEWTLSSGDKAKLTKAQDRLVNATIGLIIMVAAYGVIAVLSAVLGIDILLSDPEGIIKALQFK